MRVVVTRPEHEARQWVERLRAAGFDAVALPLIGISPAPDPAPVLDAWRRIASYAAVMFVSGNAVREFFRLQPAGAVFTPRAWSPGPGTRDTLVESGVDPSKIDAPAEDAPQFDSEALWQRVRSQVRPGQRVLVVRGGEGREWLGDQLAALGVQVDKVAAYGRGIPGWADAQRREAAACAGAMWLFSSSEGVANLRELLPAQAWNAARALATHPRIAQAARDAGFGVVLESRPDFDAVRAALESAA